MKLVSEVMVGGVKCNIYSPDNIEGWRKARQRLGRKDFCSLTNTVLDKEPFYMFINNYSLFPNCFAKAKDVDKLGFEKSIEKIAKNWKVARKYKHWFEV